MIWFSDPSSSKPGAPRSPTARGRRARTRGRRRHRHLAALLFAALPYHRYRHLARRCSMSHAGGSRSSTRRTSSALAIMDAQNLEFPLQLLRCRDGAVRRQHRPRSGSGTRRVHARAPPRRRADRGQPGRRRRRTAAQGREAASSPSSSVWAGGRSFPGAASSAGWRTTAA